VSETSGSSILTHGESAGGNGTLSLKELLNGPLLGSETKISNEKGVYLSIGTSSSWLVAAWSLS